MNTEQLTLLVAVIALIPAIVAAYFTYKGYKRNECDGINGKKHRKRGQPEGKKRDCKKREHRKSNRQSLRKITVAFSIKVTKN